MSDQVDADGDPILPSDLGAAPATAPAATQTAPLDEAISSKIPQAPPASDVSSLLPGDQKPTMPGEMPTDPELQHFHGLVVPIELKRAKPSPPGIGTPPKPEPNAPPVDNSGNLILPSDDSAQNPTHLGDIIAQPGSNISTFRQQGRDAADSQAAALAGGVTSGAVGNLMDYPAAALAGAKGLITGQGFSDPYEQSLERLQGLREGLQSKYPATSLGGILMGSMLPAGYASKFITAPTMLGRIPQAAGIGAGLGAYGGLTSGEGLEGRLQQGIQGAAIGAPLGAAGEVAATALSKPIARLFGAQSTPAAGVNPASRIANADEFGVNLTRGQATGNLPQQAWEQAALHEAHGPIPQMALSQFEANQNAAISGATKDIGNQIGGTGNFTGPDPLAEQLGATGDQVAAGVQRAASNLRGQADTAYTSAAGKQAWIDAHDVAGLGQKVSSDLQAQGIDLATPGPYPGAQSAMNILKRVAGFQGVAPGPGGTVASESLQGIEQARKALMKVRGGTPQDARAVSLIKNAFDDWLDSAVNGRLFKGDPTALDDLKEARSFWSRYRGITTASKKAADADASKVISQIATENRTGQEVINWATATAGAQQAGRTARVLDRLKGILGSNSPEWESLRQAYWQRIVNPAKGAGRQAVSSSIDNAVSGTGNPVAKSLFTPDEIDKMRRFSGVLKSTIPDARATNPSKSGFTIARLFHGAFGHLGPGAVGAGLAYEEHDPRYLALAALPLMKNFAAITKAGAAMRAMPSQVPRMFGQAPFLGGAETYERMKQPAN